MEPFIFTNSWKRNGTQILPALVAWMITLVTLHVQPISVAQAAIRANRPVWNVGDSWKFGLCARDDLGLLMDQYRGAYYIDKVLGRGNYLGFRNVYTIERRGWGPNISSDPSHRVLDYDFNLLAFYDADTGAVFTRFYNFKGYDWPLFPGKSWRWEGYSQRRDGLVVRASGTVSVTSLVFDGREYLRVVRRTVQRLPDRESSSTTLQILDQASRTVLFDLNPGPASGSGVRPSPGASCLDGHSIRGLVAAR
jgi:hypothetical protein